jgi:hypothetical protein
MHVTAHRPLRWALTITLEAVEGAAWAKSISEQPCGAVNTSAFKAHAVHNYSVLWQLWWPLIQDMLSQANRCIAISLLVTWHCCLEHLICSDADGSRSSLCGARCRRGCGLRCEDGLRCENRP